MKKHIVFVNLQAFGDVIHGINAARRYKKDNPEDLVTYTIKSSFQLTTNEGFSGIGEVLEVLEQQSWLDSVGLAIFDNQGNIRGLNLNKKSDEFKQVDKVIFHNNWYSDLGISKSANFPIKEFISEETYNQTDIVLEVPNVENSNNILKIGTVGPLDWNRKLLSESTRLSLMFGLKDILEAKKVQYEINLFGVDISNYSLLQSLQLIKNHNIFIAPLGSLIHGAAALGVDTISVPSVFPIEYDSPEFYMNTGWHKTIKHNEENHCKTYKCVTPKLSSSGDNSFGNPPAAFGFWPKNCPYTTTKLSCTKTVKPQDILDYFERWINDRSK